MRDREMIRVDVVRAADLKEYLKTPGYERFTFLPHAWIKTGDDHAMTEYLVISYAGRS